MSSSIFGGCCVGRVKKIKLYRIKFYSSGQLVSIHRRSYAKVYAEKFLGKLGYALGKDGVYRKRDYLTAEIVSAEN